MFSLILVTTTDCGDNDEGDLRTRRDLVNNATDSRLEGLETVVQELQKSVKFLRRRLKQLTHCRDSSGVLRKEGQKWAADACTTCECRVSACASVNLRILETIVCS